MIKRGLSDEEVSRIRFLIDSDAMPNTDAGTILKEYLHAYDSGKDYDKLDGLFKNMSAFVNPKMFTEVFADDIQKLQNKKPIQMKPKAQDMQALKSLLDNLNSKSAKIGHQNGR